MKCNNGEVAQEKRRDKTPAPGLKAGIRDASHFLSGALREENVDEALVGIRLL